MGHNAWVAGGSFLSYSRTPGALPFAILFCAKGGQFFASLQRADDDAAVASSAGGLAPLMTSHSMSATSPKKAGWEMVNTLS